MAERILDLLDEMTIEPDKFNLTFIFNTCAKVNNDRARKFGNKFLEHMSKHSQYDNILLTSLIHMLMKFGNVPHAEQIFELIENKDIVSYGAVLKR